ncbi:hypothetical protein RND59_04560 [Vibrio ruber]|uniref:hypothetical protein n=1 Tax=Vibrio ruber TaxID=184755 RepID=UPI00289345FD|nr:hypothetical protein [Vibrio ruber]WNJ96375.1 hypothetical protein RND59_04560 [Vibrio ruber]
MNAAMATNGKSLLYGKSKKDDGMLDEPSSGDRIGRSGQRVSCFGEDARPAERVGRFGSNTQLKDDAEDSLDAHDENVEDQHAGSINGPKKVKDIRIITTRNTTKFSCQSGEPRVKVTYEDGTEFDMERTRKKETELNPRSPNGTSPKKYDKDSCIDRNGEKAAPNQSEQDWFNDLVDRSGWKSGQNITLDGSSGFSGPPGSSDDSNDTTERR